MKKLLGIIVLSLILVSCLKNSSSNLSQSALAGGHLASAAAVHAFTYNLMTDNCHNAANAGVDVKPDSVGIVICAGESDKRQDLSGHTFNYKVQYLNETKDKVNVSFHNWGTYESCTDKSFPLDVKDSCINPIVTEFCTSSLKDYLMYYSVLNIRILPIGQKVEEPTVERCSEQTKDYASCSRCCLAQTSFWSTSRSEEAEKTYAEYVQQLSEYYFDSDFVEYLKKKLDAVLEKGDSFNSKESQEFVEEVFEKMTTSDQDRAVIAQVLTAYLTEKDPTLLSKTKTRYASQIAEFAEQCNRTCSNKYTVSRTNVRNFRGSICPMRRYNRGRR